MNARAYSLNPIEREYAQRDSSATIREAMIGLIPGVIAGQAFRDAFDWIACSITPATFALLRDGDDLAFTRELVRQTINRVCEDGTLETEYGGWDELTDDDRAIIAAELHAELRRYRAARPIPTSVAVVNPPRAPGFLTDVKGE